MIDSCYCCGLMSASLHVCADPMARKITVVVRAYGLETPIYKAFPANKYGKAIDFYNKIVETMERAGKNVIC